MPLHEDRHCTVSDWGGVLQRQIGGSVLSHENLLMGGQSYIALISSELSTMNRASKIVDATKMQATQ